MTSDDHNSGLSRSSDLAALASPSSVPQRQRFRAARAANYDLWALQAVTDTALSHLLLDDLLPALLEHVQEALRVDNAAVLLLNEVSQILTMQVVRGPEEAVAAQVRVPLGEGFAGRIAATREPLVVDDVTAFPVVNPFLREHLQSVAGVPLVTAGRLVGVLHVGTVLPRHFTAHDVQLLQQVADRMALGIDRARLYAGEQQARQAALAQAQLSDFRYQQVVDSNILGIVVSDTERVLEANDAFLRLVGYT
jgi:GAF domain-containing protein